MSQYASTPDASKICRRKSVSRVPANSTRFPMKTMAPMSLDPASARRHRSEPTSSWSRPAVSNAVNSLTTSAGGQRFAHLPEPTQSNELKLTLESKYDGAFAYLYLVLLVYHAFGHASL